MVMNGIVTSEGIDGLLCYYQVLQGYVANARDKCEVVECLLGEIERNYDLALCSLMFWNEVLFSLIDNMLMSVARLYDVSSRKDKSDGVKKGYTLGYLADEIEHALSVITVQTVQLEVSCDVVMRLVRSEKWADCILDDKEHSIVLSFGAKRCPAFIRHMVNSVRGNAAYNGIFELRNSYLAHNGFEKGNSLVDVAHGVDDIYGFDITFVCGALLEVAQYCLFIVQQLFLSGGFVRCESATKKDFCDVTFVFSAMRKYVESLFMTECGEVTCSHCGKVYVREVRKQMPDFQYFSRDICPWCLYTNGKKPGVVFLNNGYVG